MNQCFKASDEATFHVVISSDSLSFPRPWNQKLANSKSELDFRYEDTYPALLRQNLRAQSPRTDVIISNLGRRACTVGHVNVVGRDIVLDMSPDVTIIHHGIVDCWFRPELPQKRRTSEAEFGEALDKFFALREQLSPQLPIILIGILKTNARMLQKFPQQNDDIDTYNEILRSKAAAYNAHFVALDEGVDDPVQLVHEDGHHLSRTGHRRAAEALTEIVIGSFANRL